MATKRIPVNPVPSVTSDSLLVCRRRASDLTEKLDCALGYLAGDVVRYLTALDEGNKEQSAKELRNMRCRLEGINQIQVDMLASSRRKS